MTRPPEARRVTQPGPGITPHPDAPAWFRRAVAQQPERYTVECGDKQLETLVWGPRGARGLLLLHGSMANAWWWSHIAPFFAAQFRVVAFSFSGMGRSTRHAPYSIEDYAQEARTVASATGLFEAALPPTVVGHSAGGGVAVRLGADSGPLRFGRCVTVDSAILPGGLEFGEPPGKPSRLYASIEEAVSRYRLVPAQPVCQPFLIDWIARHSLTPVDGGYTWNFDPQLRGVFSARAAWPYLGQVRCPLHLIRGALSSVTSAERMAVIGSQIPAGTPVSSIAGAWHHVMLDQPLALVDALVDALMPLAGKPPGTPGPARGSAGLM